MAKEIERKFRVAGDDWRGLADGQEFRQGYLSTVAERTVRVRTKGGRGFLTVKGLSTGATRAEFEYEIPITDATELLDSLCEKPLIEKTRYRIPHEGFIWEVDEFAGANAGLIIAEIELSHEDQEFPKPSWIGDEVTDDPRYFNANLISHPYTAW